MLLGIVLSYLRQNIRLGERTGQYCVTDYVSPPRLGFSCVPRIGGVWDQEV